MKANIEDLSWKKLLLFTRQIKNWSYKHHLYHDKSFTSQSLHFITTHLRGNHRPKLGPTNPSVLKRTWRNWKEAKAWWFGSSENHGRTTAMRITHQRPDHGMENYGKFLKWCEVSKSRIGGTYDPMFVPFLKVQHSGFPILNTILPSCCVADTGLLKIVNKYCMPTCLSASPKTTNASHGIQRRYLHTYTFTI